ncbi:MAG: RdgB/HAM1 family non-canonical purine NTP pyrophosphatase [Deltaproteobacteria bacterium]|jgi:XTP/dITP diphosphohydrolase|nr:RdgB/HAM1 family non-canonical purine NTP pyrophosphatase [Deltaproteobacteria bacterium]
MNKRIVLASNNKGKIKEFQEILSPLGYEVVPVGELISVYNVEETADTFERNASIKAVSAAQLTGLQAISDDSGLCIHGLGNRPGILSARSFGVKEDGYPVAFKRIWAEMAEKTPNDNSAHFECCIVVASPVGVVQTVAVGRVFGRIVQPARGEYGFGYDPIFVPDGYNQTFAEMDNNLKNTISHRANALKEFNSGFNSGMGLSATELT